jgi:hypothetical protein
MPKLSLHLIEYTATLAAVFHQRVTLSNAYPVDTFAQVVHVL